jgi:hypothetical protein
MFEPMHSPNMWTSEKTTFEPSTQKITTESTKEDVVLVIPFEEVTTPDLSVQVDLDPFEVTITANSYADGSYHSESKTYKITLKKRLVDEEGITYKRGDGVIKLSIPRKNLADKKTSFSAKETL